eukprot:6624313-Alexandrium_andersonii.AAC.1
MGAPGSSRAGVASSPARRPCLLGRACAAPLAARVRYSLSRHWGPGWAYAVGPQRWCCSPLL